MSTVVKDLGAVSAYAYAVEKGYTGTEAEFAELMASYATVGQTAVTAAQTATTKASEAATSATTATNKASEAASSATTATTAAEAAQADADAAALDASQALSAASTATTKATEATTAAATATSAKTDAVAANTAAQSAKTAAQTAQTGAETAAASVQSSAAQIATNTSDITALKEDLNEIYVESANIYNQATDRHGININGSGVITENAGYKVSDYIYIGAGNKVTVQVKGNDQQRIYFYTANAESGFSRALWITSEESQTFLLSAVESYIVISLLESASDFMVNLGDTLLPYAPYGGKAGSFLQGEIDTINNKIEVEAESVRESSAQKNLINRFDKTTITSGYYLATSDGTLVNEDSFFASDYIDVSDLENIKCSYTHIVCFYNAQKVFISGQGFNTNNEDNSIQRPENAVYMRFSNYLTKLNDSQIGKDVSRSNYVPYGKYTLPDMVESENIIIVDANGNGDYTSLTQALYDNVDSGVNIKVLPGVYDIVSEYVAIFGQSAVDSMADADTAVFNGFQYGAIIRNRKIEFMPGAHIVCDWTGHTVDGTHRFSAIRVDYNCELIGLDLVATATFYAIHDDYGLDVVPYTVKYDNCRIEGRNLTNANCIGGGCKEHSRHILKNCYFDNNLTNSATVRYHNTNGDGAEPEIYVSNCYFNNWFTPRWYGLQTSKMRVYVNNCHARAIYKMAESSSYDVDNVELYKWCNTETDPTT